MTSSVISAELQALKSSEANITLGTMFDGCFRLQDLIEKSDLCSNDDKYQDAVCETIKFLEKCTEMVNEVSLFSSNEEIDEVSTLDMKYLLLPALLGYLKLKLQAKEHSQRLQEIQIAELYFKDFLRRCKNYQVVEMDLVETEEGKASEQSLASLSFEREKKIQHYKKLKDLRNREEELKTAVERKNVDEHYMREYYHVLLKKWVLLSSEELENIEKEKPLLKMFLENKKPSNNLSSETKPSQPLKPLVITRNEIQKKVFGQGYPSLPVMSIDDFYKQRFQSVKHQTPSSKSLQEKALNGSINETEEIEKEKLLEDDPITLQRARQWDDWRDNNPRGSGNRKNKG